MSRDAFIELFTSFVHEIDENIGLDTDEACALLVRVRQVLDPLRFRVLHTKSSVQELEEKLSYAHDKLLVLDPACTGFISYRELERLLKNLHIEYDTMTLDRLLKKYDAFESGRVNYSSFLNNKKRIKEIKRPMHEEIEEIEACRVENAIAMLRVKLYEKKTSMKELYLQLNRERFGYLTIDELDFGLKKIGVMIPKAELEYIVQKCTKKESMLSLLDFCKLVESLPEDFKQKTLPIYTLEKNEIPPANKTKEREHNYLKEYLKNIVQIRGQSTKQFYHELCNGSNSVSIAAIENILWKWNCTNTKNDIVKLVGLYDTTGSGTLDYHEFVYMLQS
ncbi:hypothetical protein THRCLA_01828 [Thraustotheca clavata]|uniref:Calmodulin n=1 Tax=Thraustotheca clavata TaxID=74557 RepID=A0A1W0A7F9_9STRA|nr:hypothetical protein THRCLA_01828 [Thraustotheca clavata]